VKAFETALLVGALGLDQTAAAQVLLAQPLVGGAVLGWSAGDPGAGLLAGAFFQFLCLTDLPVGASIPPDTTLAGLLGVAVFLALGHPAGWGDQALLGLLAVGFLPLALLARRIDVGLRHANRAWEPLTARLVERGRFGLAQAAANGGLLFAFLRPFALALALLAAAGAWRGAGLERLAAAAPVFAILARLVPLVGLSALIAQRRRAGWPATLAAGVAAAVIAAQVTS
jgi:mannose/fructose/N-acetylgalactosamine-specific phosphotransferase system component IIC